MKDILINILLYTGIIGIIISFLSIPLVSETSRYKIGIVGLISTLMFTVGISMFGAEHPYREDTIKLINDNDKYVKVDNTIYEVLNHSNYHLTDNQKIEYEIIDTSKIIIMRVR